MLPTGVFYRLLFARDKPLRVNPSCVWARTCPPHSSGAGRAAACHSECDALLFKAPFLPTPPSPIIIHNILCLLLCLLVCLIVCFKNKQINSKQTSKQTNKQTNEQTSKQTNKQANKQSINQTNKQRSKQNILWVIIGEREVGEESHSL